MVRYSNPARARCRCGAVQLEVKGAITRFYCHCGICQRLNDAPYGEPVFAWRWDVAVNDPSQLTWKRHRRTPINVNRGTCRTCGTLILEHLALSPVSIVIASTWENRELLPPPQGHAFYETRVADIEDDLPKRSGYVSSQLAVTKWLATAALQGDTQPR